MTAVSNADKIRFLILNPVSSIHLLQTGKFCPRLCLYCNTNTIKHYCQSLYRKYLPQAPLADSNFQNFSLFDIFYTHHTTTISLKHSLSIQEDRMKKLLQLPLHLRILLGIAALLAGLALAWRLLELDGLGLLLLLPFAAFFIWINPELWQKED
jgi:hypothetical protein